MSIAMRLAAQAAGRDNGALNVGSAMNNMSALRQQRMPVSPVVTMAPGVAPR